MNQIKEYIFMLLKRGGFRKLGEYYLPDKIYLKILYRRRMGRKLRLKQPEALSEKLQWLKLYDRKKIYTNLVDKYEVRKIVSKTIGEKYLTKLYNIYDDIEDINYDELPNEFVMKVTHDSGGVFICKDKKKFNFKEAKVHLKESLNNNYFYTGREWPYKNIKPRIIVEEYLEDDYSEDLKDYKILCFNGEPKIIQVMSDRKDDDFLINHFDLDWNELDIKRKSLKKNPTTPQKPLNLDRMIELSQILSDSIPFVRVDFYEVNGKLIFGEITFYPVSGFIDFEDYQDDIRLGAWIKLPKKN